MIYLGILFQGKMKIKEDFQSKLSNHFISDIFSLEQKPFDDLSFEDIITADTSTKLNEYEVYNKS